MRCRDADAGGGAHGIQQVVGERAKFITEHGDGFASGFQARVGEAQNGADDQENLS
jgi:hypothetical protein